MADSAPAAMGAYASKIVWGSNGEPVAPGSPDDSPFFDLRIRVVLSEGATAPEFKSAAAAGMDLCARVGFSSVCLSRVSCVSNT